MKISAILLIIFFAISLVSALALGYFVGPFGATDSKLISFQAVAITNNGNGVLVPFQIKLSPGNGKILVNVNSNTYSTDSDRSLQIAKFAAEKYLGKSLNNFNIELDSLNPIAEQVSGMSATTLFSSAIVADYLGVKIPSNIAVSATINTDGTLGPVGGIDEKILAATASGKKFFLVSENQQIANLNDLNKNIQIVRENDSNQAINFILNSKSA